MSMIELGITLAIISIIVGIAFPNLMILVDNQRLHAAARDLLSNFQRAKMEAMKRSVFCTVTFNQDVGGETYDYVLYVDTDQDLEYDAGEEVLSQVRFSDYESGVGLNLAKGGVNFIKNDEDLPSVAFDSRGFPRKNSLGFGPGSVYIKNNRDKTRRIVVNAAGRILIRGEGSD
jgi:type IV fimbrial biogenesis protein FimT